MTTPEALITVQKTQRFLFRCMIDDAGMNPEDSMKIMAFWMWLELQGCQELVNKIASDYAKFLIPVSIEAKVVLASLQPNSTSATSQNLMPITSNLSQCFFSIEEKIVDKEAILKDIENLYNNSCLMLFQDILEERGVKIDPKSNKGENDAAVAKVIMRWMRSGGEGTSKQGAELGGVGLQGSPLDDIADEKLGLSSSWGDDEVSQVTAPLVPPKLNPFAREWNPMTERASKIDRSLYLTFSNGFPLNECQIANFFTKAYGSYGRYGSFIERVYVHWPHPRKDPPLFAKVVFTTSCLPVMILSGQKERTLLVDGIPLRCKKYEPRKNNGRGGRK